MTQTTETKPAAEADKPKASPQWPALIVQMSREVELEPSYYWNTIKATCGLAKSSNEVVISFLMTAKKYKLDPMVKQIYAFEKSGKVFPIVPIDGWLKLINEHADYDGMDFVDAFDKEGKIFSITCTIFRKDRSHPTVVTEYLSECAMSTDPWKKWPIRMLRHKVAIQAARYAFSLAGIYDPDEGERIKSATSAEEVAHSVEQHMQEVDKGGMPVNAEFEEVNLNEEQAQQQMKEPSDDWEAVYDELAPGIETVRSPVELAKFLEENSEMIEKMGTHAPRKLVEKWVQLVNGKQKSLST